MKRITFKLAFVATGLLLAAAAGRTAEPLAVPNGFLTGNSYRVLSESERTLYIMGVWDGLVAAPLLRGSQALAKGMHTCAASMTNNQITAIVDKYVNEHPENWHYPMHLLVNAIQGTCPALNAELSRPTRQ